MITLLGLGLLAGLVVSWAVLRLVRAAGVVAEPNERSSHRCATPTSGGLGFVALILAFCVLDIGEPLARVMLAGGGLVALIGLIDDLWPLSAAIRLPVQVVAVAIALWLLGIGAMTIGSLRLEVPWVVGALGLAGVWLINLYNFMDGIDGIAASQFLVFGLGLTVLGATGGFAAELTWFSGAAVAGFLLFNWAPARVFMGDVGSGFLGFMVWGIAIALAAGQVVPFVASMVLLTAFWFDATYTLGIRMVTGQPFASAHRSHLYQHLAIRIGHGSTVIAYVAYGVLWLLPLAVGAERLPDWWPLWVGLGCAPIAAACVILRAGRPEQ